ncbi:uncharacterized protein ACBR49_009615 [Aulostomus maculatus]
MALLMTCCTFLVNVLCLPLHLIHAVGLYTIYKRVLPLCLQRISRSYNKKMHDRKKELFRTLPEFNKRDGQLTILEIGCGTGTNFQFYPPGCKVICTDKNPHFKKYLQKSMDDNDQLSYEKFVVSSGEDMKVIDDGSVDVVVCTLVLCSVNNIPQTLREAQRMLRPGGAFFFLEHVVASEPSSWTYFFQHVMQPAWYYFGDGCEVTRATWKHLEEAGFSDLKLRHITAPFFFLIKPHIIGYAVNNSNMKPCLMKACRLLCLVMTLPLHLMELTGVYGVYKRLFPLLAYNITFSYNDKMHRVKRELFRNVCRYASSDGTLRLLEIGCGSGANFQFYPHGCTVVCTDSNPHFESYLQMSMDANKHLTYDGFLVVSAEDMKEVPDESVDVVVCTLVLCSVDDVQRVLREVRRILRTGGAFFFLEHVVSGGPSSWVYFIQHVFEPLWYYLGDGCRITRATWKDLESAGFSELHLRHIEAPQVSLAIRPHIVGYSIK